MNLSSNLSKVEALFLAASELVKRGRSADALCLLSLRYSLEMTPKELVQSLEEPVVSFPYRRPCIVQDSWRRAYLCLDCGQTWRRSDVSYNKALVQNHTCFKSVSLGWYQKSSLVLPKGTFKYILDA